VSQLLKLQYFFDPLCGWCYASAPSLAALATQYPRELELMPSGLFSGVGARSMSREWASHAWRNDQRIAQLTGQRFTDAYRAQVLHGDGVRFDSGCANRALTAMRQIAPALESRLLHDLQLARYVEGRDTATAEVIADVAAVVAALGELPFDKRQFAERLASDNSLELATAQRIATAQELMRQRGVSGVPLLWVSVGAVERALHGSPLYQGGASILAAIDRLLNYHEGGDAPIAANSTAGNAPASQAADAILNNFAHPAIPSEPT
jgi:putative protein-disulfide isomerase